MAEEFKKFESHCSKCIFATYVDNWSGPHGIQDGCKLGRLEKFKKQNLTRVDETGHFVVKGICNTNRGQEWANHYKGADLIEKVKKEIQIGIDIVILSLKDPVENLESKLEKTIDKCLKQKDIKPPRIIVVVQNPKANFKSLYNNLSALIESYDIRFQLMQIPDQEMDISECVNMAIIKCKSQYSAVFQLGNDIPIDFISKFNKLINEDLAKIVLVEPFETYSGMIVQTKLFRLLGKNKDAPIFTKIKELCQDKETKLIITWDNLCHQE